MSGYQPKVYREQGGNRLVVEQDGEVDVKPGGKLNLGGTDFAAVLAAIPTADQEDGATLWLDNGVLKVSSEQG